MIYALTLGFLIGLRHAVEADHLAAVATLVSRSKSIKDSVRHGAVWGVGHTLTLLFVGSLVLASGVMLPETAEKWLEAAVGCMLIGLGLELLWRMLRGDVHIHIHEHDDGQRHVHLHRHAEDSSSTHSTDHHHSHKRDFPVRALCIGLMHGLAGSAALIVLSTQSTSGVGLGLAYIALFGIGSIVGMACLSMIIAIPIKNANRRPGRWAAAIQWAVVVLNLGLGSTLVSQLLLA